MILFLNVFITDQAFTAYDRGYLGPPADRLDVFKYSLASLAVLPWSAVYINSELDTNYLSRKAEFEAFVYQNFPHAVLSFERNINQKQWQKNLTPIMESADPVICFLCNDDHVFIDSSTETMLKVEKKMRSIIDGGDQYCSCYVSHWPEMMSYLGRNQSETERNNVSTKDNPYFPKFYEENEDYAVARWHNIDSVQLVSKELLRYWWFAHDYGDARLPRSDSFGDVGVQTHPEQRCIFPKREQLRHFDAYSHAKIDINRCPPLLIPPGFFENSIRITYGAKERVKNYFHINPCIESFSFVDPHGVDMRCVLEDLPLFWKLRLGEVVHYGVRDRAAELRGRNEALMRFVAVRLPWSIAEIVAKFPRAVRREGWDGELPENGDFLATKTSSYPWVYHRAKTSDKKLSVSLLLVDTGGEPLELILNQLHLIRQQCAGTLEVILTSVRQAPEFKNDWARPFKALVDTIVVYRQPQLQKQGSYNVHQAINAASREARSEHLLIADTRSVLTMERIEAIISSVQNELRHVYSTCNSAEGEQSLDLLLCSTALFNQCGGLDEGRRFLGHAWSLQSMLDRIRRSAAVEIVPSVSSSVVSSNNRRLFEHKIENSIEPTSGSAIIHSSTKRWSDQIDDLAISLALGKTQSFEQIFQQLLSCHALMQERFFTELLQPFSQGNLAACINYFERNRYELTDAEKNLYVALLLRLKRNEEAKQILSDAISISNVNLVSLLLRSSVSSMLTPEQSHQNTYLIETRFPEYLRYLQNFPT